MLPFWLFLQQRVYTQLFCKNLIDFTLYSKVCTKSFDIFPFIIVDFVVHVFVDVVIVVALVFRFVFDHKLGK